MKTILILSQDEDQTTDEVIKWLKLWRNKVIRINTEDILQLESLNNSEGDLDFFLKFKNRLDTVKFSEIKSFWLRRGRLHLETPELNHDNVNEVFRECITDIHRNMLNENNTIIDTIAYLLNNNIVSIGNYQQYKNNKLIHHELAKKVGLFVPISFIHTRRHAALELIINSSNLFIIKPISDSPWIQYKDSGIMYTCLLYSTIVTSNELNRFPQNFFPTLFQVKIEKIFEIRSFFIKGSFYSMAILSQNDNQTDVDFRRYNKKKPNRWVPFILPDNIVNKLVKFMQLANLDTGSIDLIYGKDQNFYFLEVNPVGQFGMVSGPCNYNIESKIAKILADA